MPNARSRGILGRVAHQVRATGWHSCLRRRTRGEAVAGRFVTLVLDGVREVPPNVLLTLIALADRANQKHGGEAWPSVADIAERTNRQERQVRDDLRTLERQGWINHVPSGRGGRGRTTVYQLNFAAMLHTMSAENAALHCRELRKIPGALPPGFTLTTKPCTQLQADANLAVSNTIPGSFQQEPGAPAHETRRSSAPELKEPELKSTGVEPEGAHARASPSLTTPDPHPSPLFLRS